jgi:Flp pilus assembly protein TadG
MTIPTLLLLVGGMLYLGRALHTRGRLVDAVAFAARAEAIAVGAGARAHGDPDATRVTVAVTSRMRGDSNCVGAPAITVDTGGVQPTRFVTVTAECNLAAPILGAFLPTLSLNSVRAQASMPLDYEAPPP